MRNLLQKEFRKFSIPEVRLFAREELIFAYATEGPLAGAVVLPFSEQFWHPANREFKSLNFLIREQRN